MTTKLKLSEIAARINAHLRRFEADPVLNAENKHGHTPFYSASASAVSAYVVVYYIAFQGHTSLTRDEALRYLAWLDAGHVGRHTDAGVVAGAARREAARAAARTREQARIKAEEERAAAVVFEPVTTEEAESLVEHHRAGSDMWRVAKTLLLHLRRAS